MTSQKLTRCILATVLLLLSAYLFVVEARSFKDAPPSIIEVSPATIGKPQSYIQVAKSDINDYNVLTCVAENADDVFWKYKATLADESSTDLPMVMQQLDLQDDGRKTTRTLTDKQYASNSKRHELNGYYQCFAKSNYVGNEYQSLTPLIHMLYADVSEGKIGKVDARDLYSGDPPPTIGKPYRLPCIRDPDLGQGGFTLNPPDAADLPQARVTFQWNIRNFDTNGLDTIDLEAAAYEGRVRMDPRTGDLYFAELKTEDSFPPKLPGTSMPDRMYQCSVVIGQQDQVLTNQLYLTITANTGSSTALVAQYPHTDNQKRVTCVEGGECRLTAIFGGTASIGTEPEVIQPGNSNVVFNRESYGVSFPSGSGTTEDSGEWKFKMVDAATQSEVTITLQVTVLAYPVLLDKSKFPDERIAFSGENVVYECKPEYTESFEVSFYINGEEVKEGRPPHVTYDNSQPTTFYIDNVMRNQSASIACIATNNAGTMFELAQLTVFDAPVADLNPKVPYIVQGINSTDGLLFNCSFKLDEKTDADSVKLWWRSNHTELTDKRITKGDISQAVAGVHTTSYSISTSTTTSELNILADSITSKDLDNTRWWCECSYTVLGNEVPLAQTIHGVLQVPVETKNPERQAPPPSYTFVIVGAVLGFLFFILLIVLIHCYVQKNKGEQYRVDENERKAGHNPEEEMKAYGYVDYNRPDQNPVKGSRASMNFSERPLESDHGSMDEYGDIDTGRFNEDGSFIGEYRGQNNHRNQADV